MTADRRSPLNAMVVAKPSLQLPIKEAVLAKEKVQLAALAKDIAMNPRPFLINAQLQPYWWVALPVDKISTANTNFAAELSEALAVFFPLTNAQLKKGRRWTFDRWLLMQAGDGDAAQASGVMFCGAG